jgi:hypothetical protein
MAVQKQTKKSKKKAKNAKKQKKQKSTFEKKAMRTNLHLCICTLVCTINAHS